MTIQRMENVGIVVEDRADDATLHEMNIESAWELSGLYRGTPLTHRSVMDPVRQPDRIFIYREAILVEWIETGEDLYRQNVGDVADLHGTDLHRTGEGHGPFQSNSASVGRM